VAAPEMPGWSSPLSSRTAAQTSAWRNERTCNQARGHADRVVRILPGETLRVLMGVGDQLARWLRLAAVTKPGFNKANHAR